MSATKQKAPAAAHNGTAEPGKQWPLWDRARRVFGDGEEAYVAAGVSAGSAGWHVMVDLSPDEGNEGQVNVRIFGAELVESACCSIASLDGVGFSCPATELEKLGRVMLKAARGLRELTNNY